MASYSYSASVQFFCNQTRRFGVGTIASNQT